LQLLQVKFRAKCVNLTHTWQKAGLAFRDSKREILGKPRAGVLKPKNAKSKRGPHWNGRHFSETGPAWFEN